MNYRKYLTKKNIYLSLFIFFFTLLVSYFSITSIKSVIDVNNELYKVVAVTDGDTITVKDSTNKEMKVRYIGMDTPESVKPNTPVQCFAKEASDFNKNLVLNKTVKLEPDVSDKDKYGRSLRYVYLDQNNDGKFEDMVNDILVKEGYAKTLTIAPDVKYADKFLKSQTFARENNKGLWNKCYENVDSNLKENYVTNTPKLSPTVKGISTSTNESCQIKGNISADGEKIYHMPGQRYYSQTQVETDKGEQWFCTEQDAINAGYRKSKV